MELFQALAVKIPDILLEVRFAVVNPLQYCQQLFIAAPFDIILRGVQLNDAPIGNSWLI